MAPADPPGIPEADGAEGEKAILRHRHAVLGAEERARVAAEALDGVAAQIARGAERELLVEGQVAAVLQARAQLELMLLEQPPAVDAAQKCDRVVVVVEP